MHADRTAARTSHTGDHHHAVPKHPDRAPLLPSLPDSSNRPVLAIARLRVFQLPAAVGRWAVHPTRSGEVAAARSNPSGQHRWKPSPGSMAARVAHGRHAGLRPLRRQHRSRQRLDRLHPIGCAHCANGRHRARRAAGYAARPTRRPGRRPSSRRSGEPCGGALAMFIRVLDPAGVAWIASPVGTQFVVVKMADPTDGPLPRRR